MEWSFRRARRNREAFATCSRACSIATSSRRFRRDSPRHRARIALGIAVGSGVLFAPDVALAQPDASGPAELLARPITLILAIGLATLLPFAFMTLTAFVKI